MNDLPIIVRGRMKITVATDHPDPDLLTAFAEQALPERERAPVLEHLARCADCREVLALAAAPVGSATQTKDTAAARKAPWFSFPVLRWGALAACFVIVGTAVLIHRDEKAEKFDKDQRQIAVPKASAQLESSVPASSTIAGLPSLQPSVPAQPTSKTNAPANKVELRADAPLAGKPEEALAYSRSAPNQLVARVPQPAPNAIGGLNTFVFKKLRDDRQVDAANSAAGSAVGGPALVSSAPVPSAKTPAPSVPGLANERKDAPTLAVNGRNTSNDFSANEPVATMVDAAGADSDKKVEVMGRAKTAGASGASAALAVAPDDTLDMQRAISPSPDVVAKARKERAEYGRPEILRWNLSSDGQLRRSIDSGKTWQPVSVAEGVTFRALTFNGPDVWVGGAAGSLYHSPDAGAHWVQVKPTANGVSLSADISAIAFTDPQHGKITTTNGQTWTTGDGGKSWTQQP